MNSSITKETWINPKIRIGKTTNKGKGMFAIKHIKAGEDVLVWGGEYKTAKEVESVQQAGKLVLQWDEDLYSIEDRGEDVGYFINHACDSNTWMSDAYTLVARRNIQAGEEVTADYALWECDQNYISKWSCQCGSQICRQHVTGQDWKETELQARYKDHFSPLINKLIKNVQNQKIKN